MAPCLRAEFIVLQQVSPQWRLESAPQVKHSQFEININGLNTFEMYKADVISLLKSMRYLAQENTLIVSIKHCSDLYVHFGINIDHLPSNGQLFYNTFW